MSRQVVQSRQSRHCVQTSLLYVHRTDPEMRILAASVLFCLVLACSAQDSWIDNILNSIDSLFETYEEAPFVLVKTYDAGYQERRYPARKWVCTDRTAASGEGSATTSFMTLFRYITGTNEEGQSIRMTIPVSTEKTPTGSSGMNRNRMCFYIGEQHQQNSPTPTEEGVFIENRPEITIFTRQIGGWPNDSTWDNERRDLEALVASDGNSVRQDDAYMSVFQSPMVFWARRNELWLIKN